MFLSKIIIHPAYFRVYARVILMCASLELEETFDPSRCGPESIIQEKIYDNVFPGLYEKWINIRASRPVLKDKGEGKNKVLKWIITASISRKGRTQKINYTVNNWIGITDRYRAMRWDNLLIIFGRELMRFKNISISLFIFIRVNWK